MRTRDGQSSSEEEQGNDSSERTPLVSNRAPPPLPPPPPPSPAPRRQQVPQPPPPARRSTSGANQQAQAPQPTSQARRNTSGSGATRIEHPPPLQPLPPPPYPPPASPPPPPAVCGMDWVLKIHHPGKGVLRIHVPKGMTAYLLSKCIIQATDHPDGSVVGLFGYHNGMFVSLEHLLSCSEPEESQFLQKQLYSLYLPQPMPKAPWWYDWRIILGGLALFFGIIWQKLPLLLRMISKIPFFLEKCWDKLRYFLPLLYHSLVTQPLKETYRYGPAVFGGWEGASLPSICARMTYGDQEFWERNYSDCQAMYLAKESAFLFVGRPLVFLVMTVLLLWILRQWLWYRALRHNQQQDRDRYQQDRDMIQTYRAFQVLFRQFGRMMRAGDQQDRGGRRQVQDGFVDNHHPH